MKERRRKRKKGDSPILAEMKELVAEGYSLKKAMELAGYSKTTIEKKASEYLRKMDLNVLRRVLKPMSAVANIEALKVLQEEMAHGTRWSKGRTLGLWLLEAQSQKPALDFLI